MLLIVLHPYSKGASQRSCITLLQVPINTFHLNVAIKAARRSKDWRMAFQLLETAAGMLLGSWTQLNAAWQTRTSGQTGDQTGMPKGWSFRSNNNVMPRYAEK